MSQDALQVPATAENIRRVCAFVVAGARAAGLDEQSVHQCELAADEVCVNVCEYGFSGWQSGGIPVIQVQHQTTPTHFIITISDNGIPFDPLQISYPDSTPTLEELRVGGWGLLVVKKMMDEVRYRYHNGQNHLSLYKKRP